MSSERSIERDWNDFGPVELAEETRRIANRSTSADEINAELLRRFGYPFHVYALYDPDGNLVEGKMWSNLGRGIHF